MRWNRLGWGAAAATALLAGCAAAGNAPRGGTEGTAARAATRTASAPEVPPRRRPPPAAAPGRGARAAAAAPAEGSPAPSARSSDPGPPSGAPGRAGIPTAPWRDLTYEEAIAIAQGGHPALSAARGEVEAAAGRARQARLWPNPEAFGGMESAPIRGHTADRAEYVAGLRQVLPVGGRLGAARDAEEAARAQRLLESEARAAELRTRVRETFQEALLLAEAESVLREGAEIAARGVDLARARTTAGDATPGEVARAEAEAARARLEADRAETRRLLGVHALAAALGLRPDAVASIRGDPGAVPGQPDPQRLDEALGRLPQVRAAEAEIAVQRAREDHARAERVPDVSVDVAYRRLEDGEDAFDVGVSVPLPLFDRNQGALRAVRGDLAVAEARAAEVRLEQERALREAQEELARSLASLALLRAQVLPRVDEALRATEARYAAGDLDLQEVLLVRRDRLDARREEVDLLREVWRAWARLEPYLER